jgi:hypothetical protein
LKALGVEVSEEVLKMQELALERARAEILKPKTSLGKYVVVE